MLNIGLAINVRNYKELHKSLQICHASRMDNGGHKKAPEQIILGPVFKLETKLFIRDLFCSHDCHFINQVFCIIYILHHPEHIARINMDGSSCARVEIPVRIDTLNRAIK